MLTNESFHASDEVVGADLTSPSLTQRWLCHYLRIPVLVGGQETLPSCTKN